MRLKAGDCSGACTLCCEVCAALECNKGGEKVDDVAVAADHGDFKRRASKMVLRSDANSIQAEEKADGFLVSVCGSLRGLS